MKRLAFALVPACAACAGALAPHAASGVLPGGISALPPPVSVRYDFSERYELELWTGPTAHPIDAYGGNAGSVEVAFAKDARANRYDVREQIRQVNGNESWRGTVSFANAGGAVAQVLESDESTTVAAHRRQTALDTFPSGRIVFEYPPSYGLKWDAAARDLSSYAIVQTQPGAFAQTGSADSAPDGTYTSQTNYSSTRGAANRDDYAATTAVSLFGPSVFRLSERAAGFNPLTQTFALPAGGAIAVTSSGKPPLPVRPGRIRIKSWYPLGGGAFPRPLYRDRFRVRGKIAIPAFCGRRKGETATRVDETSYDVDPVQGTVSVYAAVYLLTPLGSDRYLIACVAENYTDGTYANGRALGGGSWGRMTRLQTGTAVAVAHDVESSDGALRAIAPLRVLEVVPPVAARLFPIYRARTRS
ncbi:MAG TPA: hypothetical protein VMF61_01980 [Candidatus Acidoferrales bacterium]|nr:hypothetical protein [Candidatus Acidoferrales bacterium]